MNCTCPTQVRYYNGNYYLKQACGWHTLGFDHRAGGPITIGSWSKEPVERSLKAKLLRDGKICVPPWRGRSPSL